MLATILQRVGDAVLAPFVWLPPWAALLVLSLALGLLFLGVFRLVGPTRRLRRVKDLMGACLYEMRIFASRPGLVLRAQGRAVLLVIAYIALTLPPLAVLAPPLTLLIGRAATHYEFRPPPPGKTLLVAIDLDPAAAQGGVKIEPAGEGLEVRPPVIVVQGGRAAYARVIARQAGRHTLRVVAGDVTVEKIFQVGGRGPVSLVRDTGSLLHGLLGHEPVIRIPSGVGVRSVSLDLGPQPTYVLGMPWWLFLTLASLAVALLLRRRLGVVF
jgi:hypothetical protein